GRAGERRQRLHCKALVEAATHQLRLVIDGRDLGRLGPEQSALEAVALVHLQRQAAEVAEAVLAQLVELAQVAAQLAALARRLLRSLAVEQPHQMPLAIASRAI